MQIPWLNRPPTVDEVAAHAKAYPCQGFEFTWSCWLQLDPTVEPCSLPRLRFLRGTKNGTVTADKHGTPAIWKSDEKSRWLPCTAEGIPVCFARRLRKRSSTCEICGKRSVSLGFCHGHYRRLLRYGSPTGTSITLFEFEGRRQTASQWAAEWGVSRQHVRCLSTDGRLRAPAKLLRASMRAGEAG